LHFPGSIAIEDFSEQRFGNLKPIGTLPKMTVATIEIPKEYGYVILAATSSFLLNAIHGINTGKFRKAAKVPYPNTHANPTRTDIEALRFNCAQRAHMNYTENLPSFLGALLLAGLKFPLASAALGFFWSFARYLYMVGYSTGAEGGKGRLKGIYYVIAQYGLIGLAIYNAVTMILDK